MAKKQLFPLLEHNKRGRGRDQHSRRMVALYDYDPRESSPNVDVEVPHTPEDRNTYSHIQNHNTLNIHF